MKILSAFDTEEVAEAARSFAALSKQQKYEQITKASARLSPYLDSFGVDGIATDFLEAGLFEELMSLSSDLIKQVESMWDRGPDPRESMIIVSLSTEHEHFSFAPNRNVSFKDFQENIGWMSRGIYAYELYFSFVVLAMKYIHGRDRVISILDKVTAQHSVTSLEFIRLIEADADFDEIPIAWTLNM